MVDTIFSVVVFDFDGTLVQSAKAKRKAFFDIFLPIHAPAIEAVLATDPDGSRFAVIPRVITKIERLGLPPLTTDPDELLAAYAARTEEEVAAAPELFGASSLLRELFRERILYIVSNTPQEQLLRHLQRRGWTPYIAEAFGYPNRKPETVAMLLARHAISPTKLLVVGDSKSDEEAATINRCPFYRISGALDLVNLRDPGSSNV